jgi:hypothetical protein
MSERGETPAVLLEPVRKIRKKKFFFCASPEQFFAASAAASRMLCSLRTGIDYSLKNINQVRFRPF